MFIPFLAAAAVATAFAKLGAPVVGQGCWCLNSHVRKHTRPLVVYSWAWIKWKRLVFITQGL